MFAATMAKNAQVNWDDLRFVLAVAEEGSVSAAARGLGVNHATVLRRITAFEARHGIRIFDRSSRGYRLSADSRALIEAMRGAGQVLASVEAMIEAERPRFPAGLRLTSTDTFCQMVLPPMVAALAAETGVHVEVMATNAHLDFARLGADLTVRPAMALPEELSGTRAAQFRFGVYAADAGVEGWLGPTGPVQRAIAGEWTRRAAGPAGVRLSADSFLTLARLAAAGCGRALLPVYLGDVTPGLLRLDLPRDLLPVPVWVASHVDLARSGRLQRARAFLAAALAAEEGRLMG